MTLRLPRKRPFWQAALVVAPLAVLLGMLLIVTDEGGEDRRSPLPSPVITDATDLATTDRTLPASLSAVQLTRDLDRTPTHELAVVVRSQERSAAERYVALRALERTSGPVAALEAERVVMSATPSDDGFLALNALATLARLDGGGEPLLRCAAQAPTPRLRAAAATLGRTPR